MRTIIQNIDKLFQFEDGSINWLNHQGELFDTNGLILVTESHANVYKMKNQLIIDSNQNGEIIYPKTIINPKGYSIGDIKDEILYIYKGVFMNKTKGVAYLTNSIVDVIFETKDFGIELYLEPNIIGTNSKGLLLFDISIDKILWQYPLDHENGESIEEILCVEHDHIWVSTNLAKLLVINCNTGILTRGYSGRIADEKVPKFNLVKFGSLAFEKNSNRVVGISAFECIFFNTITLKIEDSFNFYQTDPSGIGKFEYVFAPTLQGDHFTFIGQKEGETGGPGWIGVFDLKQKKLIWEYEVITQEERNKTRNHLVRPKPPRIAGNKVYVLDLHKNLHIFELENH